MEPIPKSQQVRTDVPAEEESVRQEDLVAALDMVITALQQRDFLTGEERTHLHTLISLYESQRRQRTEESVDGTVVRTEYEEDVPESVPAGSSIE